MSENPTVRQRADVLWRSVDGYLAISTVAGEALEAAGPAAEIWDLLAEPFTIDDLSARLASRHGADLEQVRSDVSSFVRQLIDDGYVERDDDSDE
ncbi:PqqD family protein [Ilumatobacter sp.]|uniref:PqqD family protein n=1 Tax=Ilumatobacter sp. TaxID=1967498 RepID=UPI003C36EC30